MIQQLITTDDKSYDEIKYFKQPSSIHDIVYRRLYLKAYIFDKVKDFLGWHSIEDMISHMI